MRTVKEHNPNEEMFEKLKEKIYDERDQLE